MASRTLRRVLSTVYGLIAAKIWQICLESRHPLHTLRLHFVTKKFEVISTGESLAAMSGSNGSKLPESRLTPNVDMLTHASKVLSL
jgi:hypothetical protein